MAKIIEVNQIEDLRPYAYFWNRLLDKTPGATFFQTLEWLETYWKFYSHGKKLRVLLVQVDANIEGILPLVEQVERTKAGPVRVVTYPLDNWAAYFGPIGSQPAATLYASLQYLAAAPRTWDMIDLRWINPEHDRGRTFHAMRCHGMKPMTMPWHDTYVIDLPAQFDEYISTRSPKVRAMIRRTLRKADEAGLRFRRYRPMPEPRMPVKPDMDFYDQCVQLAEESWQSESTSGTTISHPETAGYFRECFAKSAERGMIDVVTLQHHERLLAFGFNFHHKGNVIGQRIGYSQESKELSPGNVLMAMQVWDSIERGDRQIDLGPEHYELKSRWVNQKLPAERVCHYSPASLRANLLHMAHWWKYQRAAA